MHPDILFLKIKLVLLVIGCTVVSIFFMRRINIIGNEYDISRMSIIAFQSGLLIIIVLLLFNTPTIASILGLSY